jgi:hypothetical protein
VVGGIYNLGTLTVDALTVIEDNHVSTNGDDISPEHHRLTGTGPGDPVPVSALVDVFGFP